MNHHPELGPLREGDRVGLITPSGPPVDEALAGAENLVRSWGLEPVFGEHTKAKNPRATYLAGSDEQRASDIQRAWTDPSLKAVFCIRGGYGAVRVLDLLDVEALREAEPKPLVGSSDVTGLHDFWEHQLGLATWFAPMLATKAVLSDAVSASRLRTALFEGHRGLEIRHEEASSLVPGLAQGTLTGGNLSLLAMTTGALRTPRRRTAGKIIVLEDITEEPYRLDGMLQTLLRSGYFDDSAGVVLGTWEDCGSTEDIKALMTEALEPLGIPVVWGLRIGHGSDVSTIPLGAQACLRADDEAPRLVFE